tara:strand:+ start:981 stop:1241 length:261 start_codon:yes stop_codon:yes gene_type:complete
MPKGLYFKYIDHSSNNIIKVDAFSFADECWSKANENDAGEGRRYVLECKCGANDWTDNGRSINEYECNCCGQFITVSQAKELEESN